MNDKKKNILLICVFVLIIIFIILFFLYNSFSYLFSDAKQKQIINEYGKKLDTAILSYYNNYQSYPNIENVFYLIDNPYDIKCEEVLLSNEGKIFLNKCSIRNKKVDYSYGNREIEKREIKEGSIKVYSYNGRSTLEKPSDESLHTIYDFDIDGYYSNMFLLSDTSDFVVYYDSNNLVQMYNYKRREKALAHVEYNYILPIKNNGVYDDEYVALNVGKLWTFYNIKKGIRTTSELYSSVVHDKNNMTSNNIYEVETLSDSKVIVSNNYLYNSVVYYGLVNYKTGRLVIPMEYEHFNFIDNYFYGRYKNKNEYGIQMIHLFDNEGNKILEIDYSKLEDIYAVIPDYILAKNWNSLILVNYDGEVIYDYGEIQYNDLKYMISYKNGLLFQFEKKYVDGGNEDLKCISFYHDITNNTVEKKSDYCGNQDF